MHVPATRIVFGLAAAALLIAATPASQPTLLGFSDASSKTEREWEAKFSAIPQPANMRDTMQRLSARPHHVGSPYDKDNAEWISRSSRATGWDARIETFDVLFPTPLERVVEIVAPTQFVAKLQEPTLPQRSHLESARRAAADVQRVFRSTATSPGRSSSSTTAYPPTTTSSSAAASP